jgi:Skp family chaperone for outer membrane proteins
LHRVIIKLFVMEDLTLKRTNLFVAAWVVGILSLGIAFPASAQDNAEPKAGGIAGGVVVVLDVARVFKDNATFNKKIEAIQARAKTLKTEVETRQQQLQASARDISEKFEATSPDRKTAEAELEQQMTSLRTYARQSEAELMSEEAKVYYETYQTMHRIVSSAAAANNIALVLRFDSSECDPTNRGDVIKMVNRAVIYQANSDITNWVIGEMTNLETASAAGGVNR